MSEFIMTNEMFFWLISTVILATILAEKIVISIFNKIKSSPNLNKTNEDNNGTK